MQSDKEDPGALEAACVFAARAIGRKQGIPLPRRLSLDTLERLIGTLDVQLIALSECVLRPGFALDLGERGRPSFHYIKAGHGALDMPDAMPAGIGPQTLIIVPPDCAFRFEPVSPNGTPAAVFMLCGIFRSMCGNSMDLFDTLRAPVVERFSRDDALEERLQFVMNEWAADGICADVLVSTAMKQVIVALIRRSLQSGNNWTRRFAVPALAGPEDAGAHVIQDRDKDK